MIFIFLFPFVLGNLSASYVLSLHLEFASFQHLSFDQIVILWPLKQVSEICHLFMIFLNVMACP